MDKPAIKRSTGPWGFWNKINNADGSLYMARSWIGRLRVHVFFSGDDQNRDPHDHPWNFWTFPLTSYVEEVTEKIERGILDPIYVTRLQVVPAFRLNYRPAEHLHRVMGVYSGKVTLTNHKQSSRFDYPITVSDLLGHAEIFARRGYEVEPQWEPLNGRKLITIVWRGGFGRMWGFLKNRDGKWCWQDFKAYRDRSDEACD